MPKYQYTALDLNNKKVSAFVDARDDDDFRKIMRGKSLVPLKYKTVEEKRNYYRLKADETSEFCRQLNSMLSSGITAVRAMEILKDRDFKPGLQKVYVKLHKDVQSGLTVSEAMRAQKSAFPELLMNMFASGEASGQLEHVSARMAEHYDKEHRLNGKVASAMRYPMILMVVTVVVVLLIFLFILPNFFGALEGMDLPVVTKIMIGISQFLQSRWYLVIIAVLVLIALFQYLKTVPGFRLKYDKLKLKFPKIGGLLKIIYTARFARTLSSLYTSGVSMIRALEITATTLGNKYIESQFTDVIKDVRNGEILSASIGKIDGFDKKLSTTILIGEEAGRLDSMLVSTADGFEFESEMATGKLVQMMEPVMLVVIAVIVLVVMLSVMLPIMTMYNTVDSL